MNFEQWEELLKTLPVFFQHGKGTELDIKIYHHNEQYILRYPYLSGDLCICIGYLLKKEDPDFSTKKDKEFILFLDEISFIPHNLLDNSIFYKKPYKNEYHIHGMKSDKSTIEKNKIKDKLLKV